MVSGALADSGFVGTDRKFAASTLFALRVGPWGPLRGACPIMCFSRLHHLHQRADADNRDHALHIVGEHVERHFGRPSAASW
jgi:hypothetical protein